MFRPSSLLLRHSRRQYSNIHNHYIKSTRFQPDELLSSASPLSNYDEFHLRSREATRELAEWLQIKPGERVLDLGCGMGGAARWIASEYNCHIYGVDYLNEFIRLAKSIPSTINQSTEQFYNDSDSNSDNDGHSNSNNSVWFQQGDVMQMTEFARQNNMRQFNVCWMQHMAMHLTRSQTIQLWQDIATTLLLPRGRFGVYEVFVSPSASDLRFPLPFASTAADCHLKQSSDCLTDLKESGFRVERWQDKTSECWEWMQRVQQANRNSPSNAVGSQLVLGRELAATKSRNLFHNLQSGQLQVFQGVLIKER